MLNPRSPQMDSSTGQTREAGQEGISMSRHSTKLFLLALIVVSFPLLCIPTVSNAQVGVMITIGPPPLPVYEQPLCPGDGYIWTPGYWAYGDDFDDYYWVPGTWVLAPEIGFYWTPGYWGWGGDRFVFYDGYWGPQIGFYGGINYGFGYFGDGYVGGRWDNGHFFYNRSVSNINITEIHNVYNTTIENRSDNHVSYNGGNGGVSARPTPQQEAAARERHIPPVAAQTKHMQAARAEPQLRASVNHGKPAIAATSRPGDFKGSVVAAREAGGSYTPVANRGGNEPARATGNENGSKPAGHVRDLPPAERPAAPNTGDPKLDKKYQQQQDKQYAKQQQERQKLSQQQEKEDAKIAKHASDAQKQQVEQRHQQQTQQLQQRHQQQQQQMQQRVQSAPRAPAGGRPPR